MTSLPDAPAYGRSTLAEVMPSALAAIAASQDGGGPAGVLGLPPAPRVCVLLVDGLGDLLLARHRGHAPALRQMHGAAPGLTAGFPTTTATSMGLLGTGAPPGSHGLVGLEVLDPDRDVLMNQLAWDAAVDPRRWQPHPTTFEDAVASGTAVTRVGPGHFDGSGLTEAALRGGRFVAASGLDDRVDAALRALRADSHALVYVYWGELDKAGHVHGCTSAAWVEELERVDAAVRRLREGLPADALLVVTADHGMVDVAPQHRLDLAVEADLAAGVRRSGGEARALHLYTETGATGDVLAAWRERLGDRMHVLAREEAVAAGWFGPVAPHVAPRIGDVVAVAAGEVAVVDSRTQRPELVALLGLHGALTPEESRIPLLVATGTAVG